MQIDGCGYYVADMGILMQICDMDLLILILVIVILVHFIEDFYPSYLGLRIIDQFL